MSETSAVKRARPLSPHLQIYRLPVVAVTSITHRITGVALSVGTLMLACWLVAAASGPDAYDKVRAFFASPIGLLMLAGWSWAFCYHLLKGVQHLIMDTVRGLDKAAAARSSQLVIAGSLILTVAVWIAALAQ